MSENPPVSIRLPRTGPPVLACGADTANRVCVTRGAEAFLGDAVGDIVAYAAYRAFLAQIDRLTQFTGAAPRIVAHDMHPDYRSTRYAARTAAPSRIAVQHHHAHVAACMVEHSLTEKVIGIALDGTGYGPDGTVWGGEFLVADLGEYRRAAHFKQYRMPGGEQAILDPRRMAMGCLCSELPAQAGDLAGSLFPGIPDADRNVILQMLEKGARSPLTSSAGRLFDAVSAIIGACGTAPRPGEAAMRLQAAARAGVSERYDFEILGDFACPPSGSRRAAFPPKADPPPAEREKSLHKGQIGVPPVLSFGPMLRQIADDVRGVTDPGTIAAKFHNTLAEGMAEMCGAIRSDTGIEKIALSGGVFQNALLTGLLTDKLRTRGFQVYINESLPRGDAGLAVGQAAVALAREWR